MKTFISKFLEKSLFELNDKQEWAWQPQASQLLMASSKPTLVHCRERGGNGVEYVPDAFD